MFQFREKGHLIHSNSLELIPQAWFGLFQNRYGDQGCYFRAIEIKHFSMQREHASLYNQSL
jgi:hypothetical protein